MVKQWVPLHCHTSESNAGGYFEVVTKHTDYIQYALDHHLPAVAITNHGNVARWIKHKEDIEKAGLKYIHGIEAYVVHDLNSKERGYHTIIIAKNYEGVRQINQLSSESFNRKDGHFYYRPRILFDDLLRVMNDGNIIVTTACLAGPIGQNLVNDDDDKDVADEKQSIIDSWLSMGLANRDNFYLEIQPHDNDEQRHLNNACINYASHFGLNIIASNDIHALNPRHDEIRKVIKKGKRSTYEGDDDFELWCKSYDEMVDSFKVAGVKSEYAEEALDATMKVVDEVELFEIDKSHKYPKLYDDPEAEFKKRIVAGLHARGIDKLPPLERKKYINRVNHEYKVYKHNGAIDYMLSHEDIINAAKDHGAHFGPGRGSVSGSLIAYLCGQTEMDSVKLGLNFERFMNPERISLADIDVDAYSEDQQWIQQWMLTNSKWHAASIMTANTYGLKGAIKAIADGLPRYAGKPKYIQSIRNQIDDQGKYSRDLYEKHQELFDMAKEVVGVIDSFGRHAAGIVIDTNTIDDAMGTQTISGWDYPVTQVAMKEIDHNNWVKYDMLGLDNVGLISRAAELAGLPSPTPDSDFIDFEDEQVWASMRDNNIGVFQMEGDRAGKLLRDMLSPTTIKKIKSTPVGKKVKYMDLLSLVNAAQRPSGSSYVEAVTHGKFKDNGHPALNEFLAPTLGELVYQEQLIQFLVQFCGRTPGAADVLRRAVGKKQLAVIEREVPKIHDDFVRTMIDKYGDTPNHAERVAKDFMRVFMDAANYGFSINHSMAYSYIGYISTWLRYYYPLEWCTAAFEVWKGKQEKINRVQRFAATQGITIKPVKFRKSKGLYYMDKQNNVIYEGTATIKGINANIGDELYQLRDHKYETFTELLVDVLDGKHLVDHGVDRSMADLYKSYSPEEIKKCDRGLKEKTREIYLKTGHVFATNSKHLVNLISLNYFSEFGSAKGLMDIFENFKKSYKPNNKLLSGKQQRFFQCLKFEKEVADEGYPLIEQLKHEFYLLGRCVTVDGSVPAQYAYVTDVHAHTNKVILKLYSIKHGVEQEVFIGKRLFAKSGVQQGDLIKVMDTIVRPKNVLVDGSWRPSSSLRELWIKDLSICL